MKTDFFFREKVFLSEIVGKKDRLSNRVERLSDRAKRGQTAQRSQTVLLTGDRGKGNFLKERKVGLIVQFPSLGYTLSSLGTHFLPYLEVVQPQVIYGWPLAKKSLVGRHLWMPLKGYSQKDLRKLNVQAFPIVCLKKQVPLLVRLTILQQLCWKSYKHVSKRAPKLPQNDPF